MHGMLRIAVVGSAVFGGVAFAAQPPVFVLNSLDANVSVIDPSSWVETSRIPTGKEPQGSNLIKKYSTNKAVML